MNKAFVLFNSSPDNELVTVCVILAPSLQVALPVLKQKAEEYFADGGVDDCIIHPFQPSQFGEGNDVQYRGCFPVTPNTETEVPEFFDEQFSIEEVPLSTVA